MTTIELLQSDIKMYKQQIDISKKHINKLYNMLKYEPDNKYTLSQIKKEYSLIRRKQYKIEQTTKNIEFYKNDK